MNWLDYVIIAILLFSVIISIARGFFKEALSLLTWIAAFWIAFHFFKNLSLLLESHVHQSGLRILLSFVILFVLTLIAGSMVNFILTRLVSKAGLGGFDRLLGILFGFCRGVLFVSALLLLGHIIVPVGDPLWSRSFLAHYFVPIERYMISLLPNDLSLKLQEQTTTYHSISKAVKN